MHLLPFYPGALAHKFLATLAGPRRRLASLLLLAIPSGMTRRPALPPPPIARRTLTLTDELLLIKHTR